MMRLRVKTHAAFVVWSHAGARYASIRQDLLDIEESSDMDCNRQAGKDQSRRHERVEA